jgi:hypothetical protein
LAALTHYSGEYNLGTGTLHHHNTAKALYAGSRRRTRAPPKHADSAGWITARLALGTCTPADAALLMALCTGIIEPCVIVCVTPELRGNPKVSV